MNVASEQSLLKFAEKPSETRNEWVAAYPYLPTQNAATPTLHVYLTTQKSHSQWRPSREDAVTRAPACRMQS